MIRTKPDGMFNGGSAILAPDGNYLTERVVDEERLVIADIDPVAVRAARSSLDVAGHYSRSDLLRLAVNRERQEPTIEGILS